MTIKEKVGWGIFLITVPVMFILSNVFREASVNLRTAIALIGVGLFLLGLFLIISGTFSSLEKTILEIKELEREILLRGKKKR